MMRADILNAPFRGRDTAHSSSDRSWAGRKDLRIHFTSSAIWLAIAVLSIASWAGIVWAALTLLRPVLAPY